MMGSQSTVQDADQCDEEFCCFVGVQKQKESFSPPSSQTKSLIVSGNILYHKTKGIRCIPPETEV